MRIYIKNLAGRSFAIYIKGSDTIGQGKSKYKQASNASKFDFQWKFDGTVLNDYKTFDYYSIEEDDNITSNDRNEGGKK